VLPLWTKVAFSGHFAPILELMRQWFTMDYKRPNVTMWMLVFGHLNLTD